MIYELALAALMLPAQEVPQHPGLDLPRDGARVQDAAQPAPPMKLIWSVDEESFISVAADPDLRRVYGLTMFRKCLVMDEHGSVTRQFALPRGAGGKLLTARLSPADGRELILFDTGAVTAVDAQGEILWRNEVDPHDVSIADLDGDGLDEIVMGFVGSGGVQVLKPSGELLWRDEDDLGNVWRVAAGDVDGDGVPEVLAAAQDTAIHVFRADGERLPDIELSLHLEMIRVAKGRGTSPLLLTMGADETEKKPTGLVGIRVDGSAVWSLSLPGIGPGVTHPIEPDTSKPWAAVSRSNQVVVVDTAEGQIIGSVRARGYNSKVSWLPSSDGRGPLLLVASEEFLGAYRLAERADSRLTSP